MKINFTAITFRFFLVGLFLMFTLIGFIKQFIG